MCNESIILSSPIFEKKNLLLFFFKKQAHTKERKMSQLCNCILIEELNSLI